MLDHARAPRPSGEAGPRPTRRAVFSLVIALVALTLAPPAQATPRGKLVPRAPAPSARRALSVPRTAAAPARADGVGHTDLGCLVRRDKLVYHGGALIMNPQIVLLFWGSQWTTDTTDQNALIQMYQQLGTSQYACAWGEYAVSGSGAAGSGTFWGSYVDSTNPVGVAGVVTDTQIQDEIANLTSGNNPPLPTPTADTIYVVAPEPNVVVQASDGSTGCGGSNFVFCGYHDSFASGGATFRYAVLPFPCEVASVGTCFDDPTNSAALALQVVGSHEVTETASDPDNSPGGWFSDRTGQENADVCAAAAGGDACNATLTVGAQSFLVNSTWSNGANGCVFSVPCAPPAPPECTDGAPGFCVPGGGKVDQCGIEWLAFPSLALQRNGLPSHTVTCADGSPFCDADGAVNNSCTFHVAGCLNSTDTQRGIACTQSPVQTLRLTAPSATSTDPTNHANALTLLDAFSTIDASAAGTIGGSTVTYAGAGSSTPDSCTPMLSIQVPLRVGATVHRGTRRVGVTIHTANGAVRDSLTLVCNPAP